MHQLRVRIFEYRVQWTYLLIKDDIAELESAPVITHVSTKELYLIKRSEGNINNISEIDLVPYLDGESNDIVGT